MMMTEKYEILAKFIKDASSETADIETYLFVKENISKYQLNIDISSRALKNKLVEINTTLKFEDKEPNDKKSYYEIIYTTIIKVNDEVKEKKDMEKIILCDVPSKIYPELETSFLNLLHLVMNIYIVVARGNMMSLGFTGISFLTKTIGMLFLTWLGVVHMELDFRIYVPTLSFVWFMSHLCEAFIIQHYMEKNVPQWLQNLQIK